MIQQEFEIPVPSIKRTTSPRFSACDLRRARWWFDRIHESVSRVAAASIVSEPPVVRPAGGNRRAEAWLVNSEVTHQ